jgi:hypothetical protein
VIDIAIHTKGARVMELGAFSISLAVKDLEASRKFYLHRRSRSAAHAGGQGVLLTNEADENTIGPGGFIAVDPLAFLPARRPAN